MYNLPALPYLHKVYNTILPVLLSQTCALYCVAVFSNASSIMPVAIVMSDCVSMSKDGLLGEANL